MERLAGIRGTWPWILTGLVAAGAMIAVAFADGLMALSQIGDFLSGFAAALAFIWLIAAYMQTGHELRLQRRELSLQREAISLQSKELRRMGKYAALERIREILDQFDRSLAKNEEGLPRSTGELQLVLVKNIGLWKTILQSQSTQAVFDSYLKWQVITGFCTEFLNRVVSAIELYEEATESKLLPAGDSSVIRLRFAPETIRSIPFIQHYIGAARTLAEVMFSYGPGFDKAELRGLEAAEALMPGGVVRADALAELRARVAAHEKARGPAPKEEPKRE